MRTVLERALGLVGGRFGQILLTEGSADFGGDLVVHYTTNTPPRELGLRFGVHDSVSGLARPERRPVIVPDVSTGRLLVVDRAGRGRPSATPLRASPRRSRRNRSYQRVLEREKERIRAEFAAPLSDGASPVEQRSVVGILNVETPREEGLSTSCSGSG